MKFFNKPNLINLGILVVAIPLTILIRRISAAEKKLYQRENLIHYCPYGNAKKEVSIGNRAIVLELNSEKIEKEFQCHLEIETYRGFGLHTYIHELNIAGDERQNCPSDYIQFGRDVFAFTTRKSLRYCGVKPRIQPDSQSEDYPYATTIPSQSSKSGTQRMHIEAQDSEMDVWIQLFPSNGKPRNISIVITSFRKGCSSTDLYYRKCRYSDNCIHRDYFCDKLPNCGYPDGEVATDEQNCERYFDGLSGERPGDYNNQAHNGGFPTFPVILGAIIGIAVFFIFVFVLAKYLWYFFRRSSEDEESGERRRRPEENRRPMLRGQSYAQRQGTDESAPSSPPTAPPAYEDAIKERAFEFYPMTESHIGLTRPPTYTDAVSPNERPSTDLPRTNNSNI